MAEREEGKVGGREDRDGGGGAVGGYEWDVCTHTARSNPPGRRWGERMDKRR